MPSVSDLVYWEMLTYRGKEGPNTKAFGVARRYILMLKGELTRNKSRQDYPRRLNSRGREEKLRLAMENEQAFY